MSVHQAGDLVGERQHLQERDTTALFGETLFRLGCNGERALQQAALIGIRPIALVANGLQQFFGDRADADGKFGTGLRKILYRICRMGYIPCLLLE